MTKYFVVDCDVSPGKRPVLLDYTPDRPRRAWMLARRFAVPIDGSVVASARFKDDGELQDLIQVPIPLMRRSLFEVVAAAGVSNLDVYPAVVTDLRTGRIHDDFVAFNVIGAISAADLARCTFDAPDGPKVGVDFASLAIDESALHGEQCFRLAENVSALLVSDKVRTACLAAGFGRLRFIDPADWIG